MKNTDSLYLDQLHFDPKLNRGFMAWLISRPRIIALAIMSLVAAGAFSFINLPRELNPEVKIPIVNVVTTLPGASPADVEQLITKKLETEISDIPTIDTLSSNSSNSVSVITIQFVSTEDPDAALDLVKEKVDIVTDLPDDASDPRVIKLDFNEQPIWIIAISGDVDRLTLGQFAKDLTDRLEAASGIRRVDSSGQLEEEVTIELDQEALLTHNLSPELVAGAIAANNLTLPAGTITTGGLEYTLSVNNQFQTASDIRNLPLNLGGTTVTLGQVANVYYKTKDTNSLVFTRPDPDTRYPAITLDIYKSDSATITDAVATAHQVLDQATADTPISYESVIDVADEVNQSFTELQGNFATTILLVFFVLLTFLGLRQATTAALSIPLTFLSAFMIMSVVGITLNFLSLFSLLLALGLVVDDAIVIVQASNRYGRKFPAQQTGLLVFRDFVVPIWTTTITTVWAFLPLVLSTGIIGEFIKSIPVVVTATLISSTTIAVLINLPLTTIFSDFTAPKRLKLTLVALALVALSALAFILTSSSPLAPLVVIALIALLVFSLISRQLLTKYFRQATTRNQSPRLNKLSNLVRQQLSPERLSQGFIDFSPITNRYQRFLASLLRHKSTRLKVYAATTVFVILSVAFLTTGLLKNEFFPKVDSENLYVNLTGPSGQEIETTLDQLKRVEDQVATIPEIDSIITSTGSTFDPNSGTGSSGGHAGSIAIRLAKEEDRHRSSIEIANQLRDTFTDFHGAEVTVTETSGGPPAGADFQANIKGSQLDELETIANQFQDILKGIDGTINIDTSLKPSPGEIRVNLIPQELAERNLSTAAVGSWLRTALSGNQTSTINLEDKDQDITIRLATNSQTLDLIQNLVLPSQLGNYALSEIATFTLTQSPTSIAREDQERVVRVTAGTQGVSPQQILTQFQAKAKELELPDGYTWDVGGANEENERSVQSIIQAMGVSAVLILATMVLQLESFRKSFLVMLVIPLAVAGVFFNFTLFGIPLSFPALIGVLALFGIVVNNSIMLMEKINQNLKLGFDLKDAISDACSSRLEPIFLTSLTTAAGLLPITISDPLWQGLGGAIIAGLSVSGILILILLPALYYEIYKPAKASA